MAELVKQTLKLVEPEQALVWLEENLYARQRTVREWHVRELAQEMRAGRFLDATPITFGVLEEQLLLVNGQHTLRAIVECDAPQRLTVCYYKCVDAQDVAGLYATFDRHVTRSYSDIMKAQELPQELGISATDANRVAAAVAVLATNFTHGGARVSTIPGIRSPEERRRLMRDYRAEIQEYFSLVAGAPRELTQIFRRASLIAVALVTLRHQKEKARKFWSRVASDDGLKREEPEKTLLRWLQTTTPTTPDYDGRAISLTWNAYFQGRSLTQVRVMDTTKMILDGTPVKIQVPYRRPRAA